MRKMANKNNGFMLWVFLLIIASKSSQVFSFTLTPLTTPEQIIRAQLTALQQNDISGVYRFASPENKAGVGGDIEVFGKMVRSGAYRFLIGHSEAEILLASNMARSQRYLVRVVPADYPGKASLKEYWWSLSRCRTGEHHGCYMVDAVVPHGSSFDRYR